MKKEKTKKEKNKRFGEDLKKNEFMSVVFVTSVNLRLL